MDIRLYYSFIIINSHYLKAKQTYLNMVGTYIEHLATGTQNAKQKKELYDRN